MFYDHASQLIYIVHQVSLRDSETVQAKYVCKQFAHQHGVKIKAYHSDNKPFGNKLFVKDVETQGQTITFSGVGAHHQNTVAERAIQTITYWARVIILHGIIH